MKSSAFLLTAACLIGLSSCDHRPDIQGQWESSAIKLDLPATATSTATLCYFFSADGNVTLSSDINITEPLQPVTIDSIVPYQASVSAAASISGKWQFVKDEDDEVAIVFDDKSFALNIDPDAVTFAVDNATGQQSPSTIEMKQAVINRYSALLTPEVKAMYTKFSKIDDIKVDKNFLNFEVGDRDYILRRVE